MVPARLFLPEPASYDYVHHHGFQWQDGSYGANPFSDRLSVALADPADTGPRFIPDLGQPSIFPDLFNDVHDHGAWLDYWLDLHAKILVHRLPDQYAVGRSPESYEGQEESYRLGDYQSKSFALPHQRKSGENSHVLKKMDGPARSEPFGFIYAQ